MQILDSDKWYVYRCVLAEWSFCFDVAVDVGPLAAADDDAYVQAAVDVAIDAPVRVSLDATVEADVDLYIC